MKSTDQDDVARRAREALPVPDASSLPLFGYAATPADIVDGVCGDVAREGGFRETLIRAIADARFRVSAPEDLPRIISEALDAADKRAEERVARAHVTQNLEGVRKQFAEQLVVLERLCDPASGVEPAVLREIVPLATETRDLVALIDVKLAAGVAANADMIRESIRQHRAALDPPKIELLPGASLIASHGKRR